MKQHIKLDIAETDGPYGKLYGYGAAVMLNAFNQSGFSGYTFDDEDQCREEGIEAIKYIIETHLEDSTYDLCDVDKEIVMEFFNEYENAK